MAIRQKRTTILDIAKAAEVSTATVSRVLSNVDYPVSDDLRRRIQEVAERLNYRPNIFGQMLKGGVNKVIGIIVPSITNPFYAQLVSDVERHCIAGGYAPIICSSYDSPGLEQEHVEMLLRQQVAGMLLATINTAPSFVRKLNSIPIARVLFDQPVDGFRGSSVVFDFRAGGAMAARHLLECGHRRIVFASRGIDRSSRRLYREGCREALHAAGIEVEDCLLVTPVEEAAAVPGKGDFGHGRVLAGKLLARGGLPDAVVAANDIIAIGMMNALRESGVAVPGDVSVIGFDDIDFSAIMTPGLTTVRQSTARTAKLAIDLLFENMKDPGMKPRDLVLEPELVERDSVARVGRKGKGGNRCRGSFSKTRG